MMNLQSLKTMREWRLETFPLGRMMSLPWTRPIVTSGLSKSNRRCSPPFSVMMTVNISPDGSRLGFTVQGCENVPDFGGCRQVMEGWGSERPGGMSRRRRGHRLGGLLALPFAHPQPPDVVAPDGHHPRRRDRDDAEDDHPIVPARAHGFVVAWDPCGGGPSWRRWPGDRKSTRLN